MDWKLIKNRTRLGALLVGLILVCSCSIPLLSKRPVELEPDGLAPERTPKYEHAGWIIARGSLHNHTTYSDGCRTPEDLLELARRQGIAMLSYNDHREGEICVGRWACVNAGGVEYYGYEAYYDHLSKIQEQARSEDMIVLKGIELIPWFYNMGKSPNLVLRGLFQHFTVYGIDDPQVLENMPIRRSLPNAKPEPIPDETRWEEFVAYINDHGGMVHAVHLELEQDDWFGPVRALTPAPVRNLHRIRGLTAFALLHEDWEPKGPGAPGGLWDTVLLEFLAGLRDRPLWAVGDADYHGPHGSLVISTTLFYLHEFTEAEVLAAMREGRMVALQGEAFQDTYVAEWRVSDAGKPADKIMLGQEVMVKGAPEISFALNRPLPDITLRLIRNGVVIKEQKGSELAYRDDELGQRMEPAYYRVELIGPFKPRKEDEPFITNEQSLLVVNPIFVRFER